MNKFRYFIKSEAEQFHLKLFLANIFLSPLPVYLGGTIRTRVLRMAGFSIGTDAIIWSTPTIVGPGDIYRRLKIGRGCLIGPNQYFDLADEIVLEDRASVGPECMFITGSHEIGESDNRVGRLITKPICIGAGVWFGARCMVLPGVTVGAGAVIAAGSVVTRDVPPHTLAAGVPATVKRELPNGKQAPPVYK